MDVTQRLAGADLARQADAVLTPLMKAKKYAGGGKVVNACPFGCEDDELDDQGYCRHLVGFTNDDDVTIKAGKATFEPMVYRKRPDGTLSDRRYVDGTSRRTVLKSDQIIRITISARVYRDVDATDKNALVT